MSLVNRPVPTGHGSRQVRKDFRKHQVGIPIVSNLNNLGLPGEPLIKSCIPRRADSLSAPPGSRYGLGHGSSEAT